MTSNWTAILRLQAAACRPEAQGSQCCKFRLIPKAWDLEDPRGTSNPRLSQDPGSPVSTEGRKWSPPRQPAKPPSSAPLFLPRAWGSGGGVSIVSHTELPPGGFCCHVTWSVILMD